MIIVSKLKRILGLLVDSKKRAERDKSIQTLKEERRLAQFPRNKEGLSNLLGAPLKFYNGMSFLGLKREVIDRQIYNFNCDVDDPVIIDGGANIGIASIYFKQRYPKCHLLAYEADPNIYNMLKYNISSFCFENTELYNSALWINNDGINFNISGDESGSVKNTDTVDKYIGTTRVTTSRLKSIIAKKKIHLLKLDIEGAELEVLRDCADVLINVEKIFIEYHSFTGKLQELDILLSILTKAGFRYYIENSGKKLQQPFIERHQYHDMDLLINIYAYQF